MGWLFKIQNFSKNIPKILSTHITLDFTLRNVHSDKQELLGKVDYFYSLWRLWKWSDRTFCILIYPSMLCLYNYWCTWPEMTFTYFMFMRWWWRCPYQEVWRRTKNYDFIFYKNSYMSHCCFCFMFLVISDCKLCLYVWNERGMRTSQTQFCVIKHRFGFCARLKAKACM